MQNIWLIVAAVALLLGVAWLLVARLLENRRRLLGLELGLLSAAAAWGIGLPPTWPRTLFASSTVSVLM